MCAWTNEKRVRYELMSSAWMSLFAMTRAIGILMKQPGLRRQWIGAVVQYIRDNYSNNNEMAVDAIVGNTRNYLFAFAVAVELNLPYIRMHVKEASEVLPDPEHMLETPCRYREEKVNFYYDIHNSVVLSR